MFDIDLISIHLWFFATIFFYYSIPTYVPIKAERKMCGCTVDNKLKFLKNQQIS